MVTMSLVGVMKKSAEVLIRYKKYLNLLYNFHPGKVAVQYWNSQKETDLLLGAPVKVMF